MRTRVSEFRAHGVAFSLVEAIVGMAVFGLTVVALYSVMVSGFTQVQFARENLRATQILVEKLEAIRLYDWDKINDPSYIPRTFTAVYEPPTASKDNTRIAATGVTYTGTISIDTPPIGANYADKLRVVRIQLNWVTGKMKRSREMSTLVTANGLHTYVF